MEPPWDDVHVSAAVSAAVNRHLDESGSRLVDVQAVWVARGGETVFERCYGTTAKEYQSGMSVTKSVMSALIGIAIADGHDRGLPDDWDGQTGDSWLRADDPIEAILTSPVRPPGQQFAYSNTSAHLLGATLEGDTGQPLLGYARRKLLDPLGVDTRPAAQPEVPFGDLRACRNAGFAWPVDSATQPRRRADEAPDP